MMRKRDIEPGRALVAAIIASGAALAAIFFGPVLLESVIKPVATGLWILVRVLVLSVDQIKLWTFLIVALFFFLAYRAARALLDAPVKPGTEPTAPDENATLDSLEYWRYLFTQTPRDDREYSLTRRELARLLLSAYASKERVVNDYTLYADFKSRKILLPDGVYAFVFGDEGAPRTKFSAWLRRASGRDRIDYSRGIERYLEFLTSYMEIRDDESTR